MTTISAWKQFDYPKVWWSEENRLLHTF